MDTEMVDKNLLKIFQNFSFWNLRFIDSKIVLMEKE